MKRVLARWLLRCFLPRFLTSSHDLDRVLGQAILLQLGRTTDDQFRQQLDEYYSHVDIKALVQDLDFPALSARLHEIDAYKIAVVCRKGDSSADPSKNRLDLWARRFGLLRRIGVSLDTLLLRAGEQIPPHGHNRVVSGFYVLDGEVGARHYDRIREIDGGLSIRKVFDQVLMAGGYTTNSEHFHNIHWLVGRAPESYLFRITVVGTPTRPFTRAHAASSRVYVDPTGQPDASGVIEAVYVTEMAAKGLQYYAVLPQRANVMHEPSSPSRG